MSAAEPRIVLVGIHLEANTFCPVTTGDDFRADVYFEGQAMLDEAAKPAPAMPAEIPAFIKAMDAAGPWTPVPLLLTSVAPGGPAEQGFVDDCMARIAEGLKAALPVDAVYISNHGAMASTGSDDPDGDLVALVRGLVGPDVPIAVTLDLHANIADRMVRDADVLIAYRTNPHVDQRERATDAAGFIRRMLNGERWRKAFIRMPIVAASVTLLSARGAYADAINHGQTLVGPDLPLVSVVGGFAYSDLPKNGIAVICYGTGDRPEQAAREIARLLWRERERFRVRLTSLDEAVRRAVEAGRDPSVPAVCLADCADNPGGGGRGNTTDILEGLLAAGAERVLLGNFVDAAMARLCHEKGEGARFEGTLNAANADDFGRKVTVPIEVLKLHPGRIVGRRGSAQGRTVNLGPAAAIRVRGLTMVVCSRRVQCHDPAFFETFGLEIPSYRTVVVKSRGHFRAGFDEFFRDEQILEVDARGLVSQVLTNFTFRNLPRPTYPMNLETTWTEGLTLAA